MAGKATGRLYTAVLELMRKNGGRVELSSPELVELLTDEKTGKSTMYRVAGYIYDIRKYAQLDVTAIRVGRKVTAYELVALATPVAEAPAEAVAVAADEPVAV